MALQHNSQPGNPTQMVYSGPMSYNAAAHGTSNFPLSSTPFPALLDPSTLPPEPTYYDISVATHKQIATLQAKLDRKLGPEYISQRPGPGGGMKLTYAEGWKIINLANEVFGFNGWSSNICSLCIDYLDPVDDGKKWNCGVSAVVRVTLKDGVYHEDIGYGVAENIRGKGAALDKCKKEAVTDGIKRTLRNFGNLLGNCLYDKQYTQEVVKMKVQPPKFDRSTLHRRPEFEEGNSRGSKPESATTRDEKKGSTPIIPNDSTNMKNQPDKCKDEPSTSDLAKASVVRNIPQPARHNNSKPAEPQGSKTEHSNSTDKEEASYFNSEDDAYFMQLDIEDSGGMILEEDRPVHPEIDYEDTTLSVNIDDSVIRHPPPRSGTNENIKLTKCSIENNHQTRQPGTSPLLPKLADSNHSMKQPEQRQQASTATRPEQQTSRTATNSLGGFHFPPAMDRSNMPAAPARHMTGVKRGVDSISESSGPSNNYQREAVLQSALRVHSNKLLDKGGRSGEPLAPPYGNDVKRMRQ